MADPNELPLRLTLDDRQFVKRMRRATTFVKRNVTAIRDSVELIGIAWNAASSAVGAFTGAVDKALRASDRQVRLETRVVTALRQRAAFTDENFRSLQKFNAELDRRLGIGDEELLQLEGTLAAMGLYPRQIQSATKATIGLAQVTGSSLSETSRIVAKVFQGQFTALREYGIIVDSVEEAQTQLNAKFGIAATQGGDYTSQMSRLTNASGDALQATGKLIDGILSISSATKSAADATRSFADFLTDMADGVSSPVEVAKDAVRGLAASYSDLVSGAFSSILKGGLYLKHEEGLRAMEAAAEGFGSAIESAGRKASKVLSDPLTLESFGGLQYGGESPTISRLGGEGSRVNPRQASGGRGGSARERPPAFRVGRLRSGRTITAQDSVDARNARIRSTPGQFFDEATGENVTGQIAQIRGLQEEFVSLKDSLLSDLGPQLISGMGQLFGDLGAAMASGSAKAEQIIGRFAGNMISMLGDMLIQFGTAALGLSPLSFIPGFQGIAGAPGQSAAAGAAAIAAGAALKLAGGALGAASGGGSSSGASRGGASRSAQPSQFAGGGAPGFGRGTTVVNVSFGVVGDRRAAGRLVQGLLNDARGLSLGA